MHLKETFSRYGVGKLLFHAFSIQNGLKQGDASKQLIFNLALVYEIRNVQPYQNGVELNGTHQQLV
jgi:hypothetical protein